jgi:hypothetical protein
MAGKRVLAAILAVAGLCVLTYSRRTFVPLVRPQVSALAPPGLNVWQNTAFDSFRFPAPLMQAPVIARPAVRGPTPEELEEAESDVPFMVLFSPRPEKFEMNGEFMSDVKNIAMSYRKMGEVKTPKLEFKQRGPYFYGRVFLNDIPNKLNGFPQTEKEVVVAESFSGTVVSSVDLPLQDKGGCTTDVGFTMREISSDQGTRLQVTSVRPGSAAAATGLEPGDLIRGITLHEVGYEEKNMKGFFGTNWYKFLPLYARSYRPTDKQTATTVRSWINTNLYCRGGTDVMGLVVERLMD